MANTQDNINIVKKLFETYNKNDSSQLSLLDSIFSNDIQFHDPVVPEVKSGIPSVKQLENNYIKSFPNKKVKIDSVTAAENLVTMRWTCSGTHKGIYQNNPATNREFKISGISIFRFENGKIKEVWQNWDKFGLMEQLGLLHVAHPAHA